MMKVLQQYKFLLTLCFLACAVLICLGPNIQPDSGGYLGASYTRGLLYPLFLKICLGVWDNLHGVIFLQLIFGLGTCFYSILCFEKIFEKKLGLFFQMLLLIVLALPYVGHTTIGNTILTEPLTYPLFLLFFCQTLLWRKFEHTKHFWIALVCAVALMLTRKQFGYVFSIFYGWIFIDFILKRKIKISELFLPIIFFAASLVLEKSYMYLKTGYYTSTPSGVFIISSPLYVAKADDINSLKTAEEKQFLTKALEERDKQKLGMHQEEYANFAWPYHKKFEIIHDILRFEISNKAMSGIHLNLVDSEKFLSNITFTVLKNNITDFFKVYYRNVINSMGGYYYFYLVCCALIICFWKLIQRETSFLLHFGLQVTCLQLLNYGIVALFLPVLQRYAIYTNGLMACFWLLCMYQAFESKNYE